MKDYIVMFDYGYGKGYEVVAAKNEDDAVEEAYKLWREGAEDQADYGVVEDLLKVIPALTEKVLAEKTS